MKGEIVVEAFSEDYSLFVSSKMERVSWLRKKRFFTVFEIKNGWLKNLKEFDSLEKAIKFMKEIQKKKEGMTIESKKVSDAS